MRPMTSIDHAKFYSIVVESSGASEITMTGTRDVAKQDRELEEVFKTRPAARGKIALRDDVAITPVDTDTF